MNLFLSLAMMLTAAGNSSPVRCDNMSVDAQKKVVTCSGNAMLGQGPILLCCDKLQTSFSTANGNKWNLTKGVCQGHVRAYVWSSESKEPQEYFIWGDKGELFYDAKELVISGNPMLHQQSMELRGQKVRVFYENVDGNNKNNGLEQSKIQVRKVLMEKPQGLFSPEQGKLNSPKYSFTKNLPAKCPLPKRPGDSVADGNTDE